MQIISNQNNLIKTVGEINCPYLGAVAEQRGSFCSCGILDPESSSG
jgi:hypothetical protein